MAGPQKTTEVRYRNLSGDTKLRDEADHIGVPWPIYYPMQFAIHHKALCGGFVGMLALYGISGSWWRSFLFVGIVAALYVGYVVNRRRRSEPDFGVRDLWDERRRTKTLKARWPEACRAAGLLTHDGREQPIRLRKIQAPAVGQLTGQVEGVIAQLQAAAPTLTDVIKCRLVSVVPTGPGAATVYFDWRDPQAAFDEQVIHTQFAPTYAPPAPYYSGPQGLVPYGQPYQQPQQQFGAHICSCGQPAHHTPQPAYPTLDDTADLSDITWGNQQ